MSNKISPMVQFSHLRGAIPTPLVAMMPVTRNLTSTTSSAPSQTKNTETLTKEVSESAIKSTKNNIQNKLIEKGKILQKYDISC